MLYRTDLEKERSKLRYTRLTFAPHQNTKYLTLAKVTRNKSFWLYLYWRVYYVNCSHSGFPDIRLPDQIKAE